MDHLTIDDEHLEGTWVIRVTGDLDASSAPHLRDHAVHGLSGRTGGGFVLDLRGVAFMDSAGLGLCVVALKRTVAAGNRVAIATATPAVLRLFTVTGVIKAYPVHATVAEAAAQIRR